jgi:hypothetical protein
MNGRVASRGLGDAQSAIIDDLDTENAGMVAERSDLVGCRRRHRSDREAMIDAIPGTR